MLNNISDVFLQPKSRSAGDLLNLQQLTVSEASPAPEVSQQLSDVISRQQAQSATRTSSVESDTQSEWCVEVCKVNLGMIKFCL